MEALTYTKALEKEFVTISYSQERHFIWNEWRGEIPSHELREAILFSCHFILDNGVEFILADYTLMIAPSLDDQIWIANHSAELLRHSKLKRVANVLASDIFQQVAIETIYDIASEVPLPCESRHFVSQEDALQWLFEA